MKPRASSQFQDQGGLVALGEFHALDTVGPDLVGQGSLVHLMESQLLEEAPLVGEYEDAIETEGDSFRDAGLYQPSSDSLVAKGFPDYEGADLGEVIPANVHTARAHDLGLGVFSIHEDVPEIIEKFTERAGKELSSLGMARQHLLNLAHIRDSCFSYQSGHKLPEKNLARSLSWIHPRPL